MSSLLKVGGFVTVFLFEIAGSLFSKKSSVAFATFATEKAETFEVCRLSSLDCAMLLQSAACCSRAEGRDVPNLGNERGNSMCCTLLW
jgi:hypothetical protein